MDNSEINKGEELNQLSRLLFDYASLLWYWAIILEFIAGVLGLVIGFFDLSNDLTLLFAVLGFILLLISYVLKLKFEDIYGSAETMRRQSVITEALGWPISKTQFSRWRQKAGKRILNKFKIRKRDADYYQTQQPQGALKLLEMTIESAFWTRHLYGNLKKYVWVIFGVASIFFIIALTIVPFSFIPDSVGLRIVYSVYLLLPLILSIDLFGWARRLGMLEEAICVIERDLETLGESGSITTEQVMRLVAEYNCQVIHGFPILNRMFKWWHNDIKALWDKR